MSGADLTPVASFGVRDRSDDPAYVIAAARGPAGLVLVGRAGDGAHHVADQRADGTVRYRMGPIGADDALDAVGRILTGQDRSVTGDALRVAVGLLALGPPEPAPTLPDATGRAAS
ncbi:hypothetical protein F1188_19330 [Roseospira marina]|uniref:Uncharacterized protein n=1 Tax=Roseospira marina TaxID=140057 RepID=A0A5M6I676_9PROT|nr:hypothetical protein [Roseospira marina]KAA5603750.1 hypothetical protein F1188_19330 [Roseospira marina]MBB4316060.1 hypothetical protein [Roseospira marina]MBB5089222.1 hypothetical protein [Roseospira marina]